MSDKKDKTKRKSRKPSKKFFYFLIILIVILAESAVLCYDYVANEDSVLGDLSKDYPALNEVLKYIPNEMPIDIPADIPFISNSSDEVVTPKNVVKIGNNSIGTVTREGPYGNANSSIKVAYILGQHPRESNAHDAIYNEILNSSDSLNYSYYVYRINVTSGNDNFEESRMNGQLLAEEFVVNDVIGKNYDLAIDIHASNGGYIQDPYIFAPVSSDTIAYEAANNITKAINYIVYYEPASYSSPQYSTIPIDEGGVPAIVFEMRGNPDHSLESEAYQFIHAIDDLYL